MDPRNNKRRKDFRKKERESIKRQRNAEKQRKRRKRKANPILFILFPFLRRKHRDHSVNNISSRSLKQRRKQKKHSLKEERKSIKRKKREQDKQYESLRKKIRKKRYEALKSKLIHFLKAPIPKRKKRSKHEKLLVAAVKEARFQEITYSIVHFPSKIKKNLQFRLDIRKMQIGYLQTLYTDFSRNFKSFVRSPLKRKLINSSINSLFYFILSFILMYFTNQLVTMFTASLFKIPTELFACRIYWPLYTYSYLYTRTAMIVIFGIGPLISIILAFIFYRLFLNFRRKNKSSKDFFLWGSLHGFNLFFGAYVSGIITRTGFIYTSEWLLLNEYLGKEEIILMILSLIALLVIGLLIRKQFILASPNNDIIEPKFRLLFLIGRVLLSSLLGILIIIFYTFPNIPTEYWMLPLGVMLMVAPAMIGYNRAAMKKLTIPSSISRVRLHWRMIITTITLLVIFRFLLADGIVLF